MNDDRLYPIGDVARRTGLSVSAIRFYADNDVVAPTGHTDGGYRRYDVAAIARLELVRTLRDLGASVDDIRMVLADETSLPALATTHLALVERQMRRLRARRAVLRTIVNQNTPTEQVTLMHDLVSMSDDERDRLFDRFWTEITDGLDVHPAFVEHLHRLRPDLPADPTTEQLQAWIELAELVGDDTFRQAVRRFFHTAFASPRSIELTAPARLESMERHRRIQLEALTAERSGVAPDSPQAREIARRLVASLAELAGSGGGNPSDEHDIATMTTLLTNADPAAAESAEQVADQVVSEYEKLFRTYQALVDTINGTPSEDDLWVSGPSDEWLSAALTTADSEHDQGR